MSSIIHLDLVPQETLIWFLRSRKTEISSSMTDPNIFLNNLRDHKLVPEDIYQKVIKMKNKERRQNGVYQVLERLEKEQGQNIKLFWSCVFQEHILRKYPFLRSLQTSLLEGSFMVNEKLSIAKELTGNEEKKAEQKKGGTKRKNSVDETEEEVAGPSSASSSSQIKPMFQSHSGVETVGSSKDLEDYRKEKDGEQEREEVSEPVDLWQFEAAILPVSCGSVIGDLYKSRFAMGSHSKSIRTDERWFTPEEFVKQALTLTDGHWKKDILCHGKTLHYLVKNKVLYVHSLVCDCQLCYPDELHQDKDDVCFICNVEGLLVCCTECPRAFHHLCHLPGLQDKILGCDWMCTFCVIKSKQELRTPMSREDALNSPVLGNMLCEYLLLRLYMEDARRVLTDDPATNDERYASVIRDPMWLDKVKTKLQDNEYKTVREFVHDIRLIFNICHTFNRDNESGRMGTLMEKMFEKEFDTIFKIQ